MDGIATQQAGPLDQIIGGLALAHYNGAQPQTVAAVGFVDQNPRHQATDATKTVQHYILGLLQWLGLGANQLAQLLLHILLYAQALSRSPGVIFNCETADV